MTTAIYQRRIRFWVALFVIGLILSGLTAFPLTWEVSLLARLIHWPPLEATFVSIGLTAWIERVRDGLIATDAAYPFLAYGTDWLAFAHIVIATAFIGVVARCGAQHLDRRMGRCWRAFWCGRWR